MESGQSQAVEAAGQRAVDGLDMLIDLLEDIQKVIAQGRPKALRVRFGDKVLTEVPIALTVGAAFAAGLFAVLVTKLAIEVEHE